MSIITLLQISGDSASERMLRAKMFSQIKEFLSRFCSVVNFPEVYY